MVLNSGERLRGQILLVELLAGQLHELKIKWGELLKEEKYELLAELKEIYEKIKKDYDNL